MPSFGKIFISYARDDIERVYDLRRAAGEMVSVLWWDAQLKRSDPNWRASITTAIENASAIFVLCSPNARRSEAVSSEVEIAHSCGKQVYCLWVSGEAWAQSAPFSLVTHNYTDIRAVNGESLSNLMSELLREIVEQLPPHFEFEDATLAQPLKNDVHSVAFGKRRIFIQNGHVNTVLDVAHLLQDVYLKNDFEAFSYGKNWCLASDAFLFLPFEFAVGALSDSAMLMVLHSYLQKHKAPAKLEVLQIGREESKAAYCIMYPGEFSHSIIGVPRGKIPQLPLLKEISTSDAVGLRSSGYGEICILEPIERDPIPLEFPFAQLFGKRKAQRSLPKRGRVLEFTGNAPVTDHGFE